MAYIIENIKREALERFERLLIPYESDQKLCKTTIFVVKTYCDVMTQSETLFLNRKALFDILARILEMDDRIVLPNDKETVVFFMKLLLPDIYTAGRMHLAIAAGLLEWFNAIKTHNLRLELTDSAALILGNE